MKIEKKMTMISIFASHSDYDERQIRCIETRPLRPYTINSEGHQSYCQDSHANIFCGLVLLGGGEHASTYLQHLASIGCTVTKNRSSHCRHIFDFQSDAADILACDVTTSFERIKLLIFMTTHTLCIFIAESADLICFEHLGVLSSIRGTWR